MSNISRHTGISYDIKSCSLAETLIQVRIRSQYRINMIMMEQIRRQIPQEEFDYQTLLNCLKDYERPRDKIRALLRSGAIIRVKKGIFMCLALITAGGHFLVNYWLTSHLRSIVCISRLCTKLLWPDSRACRNRDFGYLW